MAINRRGLLKIKHIHIYTDRPYINTYIRVDSNRLPVTYIVQFDGQLKVMMGSEIYLDKNSQKKWLMF
jgi:hypothetical protein